MFIYKAIFSSQNSSLSAIAYSTFTIIYYLCAICTNIITSGLKIKLTADGPSFALGSSKRNFKERRFSSVMSSDILKSIFLM